MIAGASPQAARRASRAPTSVVWDAHKLLMMPALVTAVLFRRESRRVQRRSTSARLTCGPSASGGDLGHRTLEVHQAREWASSCGPALRVHGEAWFAQVVDRQISLASELATRVHASADFELALPPESNIVCFRHATADNRELRRRVVEDGRFYIVGTELDGLYWLRVTIMNPLIEPSDLDALLAHLRSLCPS